MSFKNARLGSSLCTSEKVTTKKFLLGEKQRIQYDQKRNLMFLNQYISSDTHTHIGGEIHRDWCIISVWK